MGDGRVWAALVWVVLKGLPRVAILGQRKRYKGKKNSATCICIKLYAFRTLSFIVSSFFPPHSEMIHSMPSGIREAKRLAQDCTASYW